MDSRGLFDTQVSQEELAADVIQALTSMHPGPDVIVYVLMVGSRYTEEEVGVYTRLKMLLDEEVTKFMLVVFTRGDALRRANKTMEDVLASAPPHLAQVLQECGGRYVVLDNTVTDNTSQVDELLQAARRIKAENGGASYVCPKYANEERTMEEDVNRRLMEAERNEMRNKMCVQELEQKQKAAEVAAAKAKEELEERSRARERELAEEARRREAEMEELTARLREQRAREEQQRREAEAYRQRLEREQREQAERLAAERRREREEAERRAREVQELLQQRLREEEAERQRRQQLHEQQMWALRQQAASYRAQQSNDCRIL